MKISFLLTCVLTVNTMASVYSQNTRFDLDIKDQTVRSVLKTIENESEFRFFYNDEFNDLNKKVTFSVSDKNIDELLSLLLNSTAVSYKVMENNFVVITPRDLQQQKKLTGTVTDNNGAPIPGANVVVTGTTVGAITDISGKYSIEAPQGSKSLTFTFIGMEPQELNIGSQTEINVKMNISATALEEVVVVGYGTQRKASLTGSVATVNSEVLQDKGVVTNPLSALQGTIPGVSITRNSGAPGRENYAFEIRGASSINGTEPLIVVDGIPMSSNDGLRTLNPDDIESMSVLKDASSAIYGARSANGVVLITMKRGKENQPIITTYKMNLQFKQPGLTMKYMNMQEWAETFQAGFANDGLTPPPVWPDEVMAAYLDPSLRPASGWIRNPNTASSIWDYTFFDTDWYEVLYGTGISQMHNLNISGSTKNSTFMISAGFVKDGSTLQWGNDWNNKLNLRLNYDVSLAKRIRLATSVSIERNSTVKPTAGFNYPLPQPGMPVATIDGKPYSWETWRTPNKMAELGGDTKYLANRINANTKLTIDILEGFQFIAQAGLNYWGQDNSSFANSVPYYSYDGTHSYGVIPSPNSASRGYGSNDYRNLTGYFDYKKLLSGTHRIGIMAGGSYEGNTAASFSAGRQSLITQEIHTLNLGASTTSTNNETLSQWAISSFFGRVNYAFKDKYLIEANGRYDGSSKFVGDNRWKFFAGISGGWRITEESFFQSQNIFDDLKLRVSWGQSGNQNGIGLYDYVQLLNISSWTSTTSSNPVFGTPGPVAAQTIGLSGMVSETRTWETVETKNIGVDFAFLKSRLTGSFDYFGRKNKNMLIGVTYPKLLGATAPTTNNGELETKGWELSLEWRDKASNFQYFIRGNLSDSRNILTYLGGQSPLALGTVTARQGYPMYTHFGWLWDGFIQTPQELAEYKSRITTATGLSYSQLTLGDSRFKDLSGPTGEPDGKIDQYDAVDLGDAALHYLFSLSAGADWKGFDFSFVLQGVAKHLINRGGDFRAPLQGWWSGQNQAFYNQSWTKDHPERPLARLSTVQNGYNYQTSDWNLEDGAYVRLKNIVLGYTLPKALISKVKLSNARVYFSGNDLWELQHIKTGWDPEAANDPLTWGNTSDLSYPFNRTYAFGLEITF